MFSCCKSNAVLKCCVLSQYSNEIQILNGQVASELNLTLVSHMTYDNKGYILRSPCTSGTLLSSWFLDINTFCTLIFHVFYTAWDISMGIYHPLTFLFIMAVIY